jgi:TonB family protein
VKSAAGKESAGVEPRGRGARPLSLVTWSISLGVHLVALLCGLRIYAHHEQLVVDASKPSGARGADDLALPVMRDDSDDLQAPEIVPAEPPRPKGGVSFADTGERGRGGETGEQAANLALNPEDKTRIPDEVSHQKLEQEARVKSANESRSYEAFRATPNPMELTFVASGSGESAARSKSAAAVAHREHLARAGTIASGAVSGSVENAIEGEGDRASRMSELTRARALNSTSSESSAYAQASQGEASRMTKEELARAKTARPQVYEAAAAVPTVSKGKSSDTRDSEAQVARDIADYLRESALGASESGAGKGGTHAAEGAPGANGRKGTGAESGAHGGGSDSVDFDTADPALRGYFREIHRRIDPHVARAFPKEALAELKQGYVTIEFTISAQGAVTVHSPPARPSGVAGYDENCAQAIRSGAPFPPIPADLGKEQIRVRASFRHTRRW